MDAYQLLAKKGILCKYEVFPEDDMYNLNIYTKSASGWTLSHQIVSRECPNVNEYLIWAFINDKTEE